ncbi:hypothetical protein C8J56DRAFT_378047 [Mycena floridula]|nr:hypothetical protein C8J56DRAFT_378047 [Mycena floridula]
MAFPLPAHLPRRSQDVSSKILSRIDEATNQTLNASLARSWLVELDETILSTKKQLHDRVHADLPLFEQQLASSRSVQTRLQTLDTNVEALSETVCNPQTGLIPTLVGSLKVHASLAQESTDAEVLHEMLAQMLRCYSEFQHVSSLVREGKLSEAAKASKSLDSVLSDSSASLTETSVIMDLKRNFNATKARTEEQLSHAYSKSVVILDSVVTILPSVQIPPTETVLELSAVLSALSPEALTRHLTALRRDLTNHVFDRILAQPTTISESETELSISPSSPTHEIMSGRLENLGRALTFLSDHFFVILPPAEDVFSRSLCRIVTTSLLNHLIIPSLPKSFSLLPEFLELVQHAVAFEEQYIIELLGNDAHDRPIKSWSENAGSHYERQRRQDILDMTRRLVVSEEDPADTFVMQIDAPVTVREPTVVPIQVDDEPEMEEDSWEMDKGSAKSLETVEEDGWGIDDEIDTNPETPTSAVEPESNGGEPDAADAWGFDDESTEETLADDAWDDPWDEPPVSSKSQLSPVVAVSPKVATRLERLAIKSKKNANGTSPMNSPVVPSPLRQIPLSPLKSSTPSAPPSSTVSSARLHDLRPPKLVATVPKESYVVSTRMKEILRIVEDVLNEGIEFSTSKIFPQSGSNSPPGTLLLQSAPAVLDIYRALFPVVFGVQLSSSLKAPIRFSNNCLYLSSQLERLEAKSSISRERLVECRNRLRVLSDSWLYDAIDQQQQSVDQILAEGAAGFTLTADQSRFDDCESAVSRVLQNIRRVAQQWKGLMTKSKYYTSLGSIVEEALTRILDDVLALHDIPEVESHRLSELCKILHSLEGLFVEDPDQPSFVVAYVPSWLKYSYLSELLEASMADITYLFEEGALVDFDVDELARLVRALFADTPLRTTLISKLMADAPQSAV